eukprot:2355647-Lingulodinium_polyedra.AAC.2
MCMRRFVIIGLHAAMGMHVRACTQTCLLRCVHRHSFADIRPQTRNPQLMHCSTGLVHANTGLCSCAASCCTPSCRNTCTTSGSNGPFWAATGV